MHLNLALKLADAFASEPVGLPRPRRESPARSTPGVAACDVAPGWLDRPSDIQPKEGDDIVFRPVGTPAQKSGGVCSVECRHRTSDVHQAAEPRSTQAQALLGSLSDPSSNLAQATSSVNALVNASKGCTVEAIGSRLMAFFPLAFSGNGFQSLSTGSVGLLSIRDLLHRVDHLCVPELVPRRVCSCGFKSGCACQRSSPRDSQSAVLSSEHRRRSLVADIPPQRVPFHRRSTLRSRPDTSGDIDVVIPRTRAGWVRDIRRLCRHAGRWRRRGNSTQII